MKSFHLLQKSARFPFRFSVLALAAAVACTGPGGEEHGPGEPTGEATGRLVIIGGALQAENHPVY